MKLNHIAAVLYACLVACGGQVDDPTKDTAPGEVSSRLVNHISEFVAPGSGFASEMTIDIGSGGAFTVASVGNEANGELGNGVTSGSISSPAQITLPFSDIKQIVTGANWSAVVRVNGDVWYWGANDYGQACNGTTNPVTTPTLVFNNIARLGAATHALFYISDSFNETWACGKNDHGQLGVGNTTSPITQSAGVISQHPKFLEIVGNDNHTLFVEEGGTQAGCAGLNSSGECLGTLGSSNSMIADFPNTFCATDNLGQTAVLNVAAGLKHSLFSGVGSQGGTGGKCGLWGVWGSGNNSSCQLGLSPCNTASHGFTFLLGTANATGRKLNSVSAALSSSYATLQGADGQDHLFVVGANNMYQLGTGDTIQRNVWTDMGGFGTSALKRLTVVAGQSDAYLWTLGGQNPVYCAGSNSNGECGVGTTSQVRTWTTSQL